MSSHLASFWLEKVDERFFIKRKSCQHFGYKYQPRVVFCCYNNSCNSSLVLCAAQMSAFEVNGEVMLVHVCLVQEFRLEDARFHTTTCALKLVRSDYRLPSPFFLLFSLLWKRLAPVLSLVSCQKLAWRRAYFFSEKLNFFQLEKTLRAAEKDAIGGVLKSAQNIFENTVYYQGLSCKSFKKDANCEHSLIVICIILMRVISQNNEGESMRIWETVLNCHLKIMLQCKTTYD